jgi:hypothetical protein
MAIIIWLMLHFHFALITFDSYSGTPGPTQAPGKSADSRPSGSAAQRRNNRADGMSQRFEIKRLKFFRFSDYPLWRSVNFA